MFIRCKKNDNDLFNTLLSQVGLLIQQTDHFSVMGKTNEGKMMKMSC